MISQLGEEEGQLAGKGPKCAGRSTASHRRRPRQLANVPWLSILSSPEDNLSGEQNAGDRTDVGYFA